LAGFDVDRIGEQLTDGFIADVIFGGHRGLLSLVVYLAPEVCDFGRGGEAVGHADGGAAVMARGRGAGAAGSVQDVGAA
jgi:hypothetical protein